MVPSPDIGDLVFGNRGLRAVLPPGPDVSTLCNDFVIILCTAFLVYLFDFVPRLVYMSMGRIHVFDLI